VKNFTSEAREVDALTPRLAKSTPSERVKGRARERSDRSPTCVALDAPERGVLSLPWGLMRNGVARRGQCSMATTAMYAILLVGA